MGKKYRLPRKTKKKIPKNTPYCYTPDDKKNKESSKNGGYNGYWIKPCPFYQHVDGLEGRCKLHNCGVMDQVKECSINYGLWLYN